MREIDIDVDLDTNDLYSFMLRHTYSGISGIFGVIISLGSLVICALKYKELDRTAIAALIIIGLIFTVIQPVMLYSKAKTQVKRNKNINAKLHYKLAEEGITVTQGEQTAQVKWYQIRKKVVTANAVYLYMSPVRAFIFPKKQCGGVFGEMVLMVEKQMEKYKDYEPDSDVAENESEADKNKDNEETNNG